MEVRLVRKCSGRDVRVRSRRSPLERRGRHTRSASVSLFVLPQEEDGQGRGGEAQSRREEEKGRKIVPPLLRTLRTTRLPLFCAQVPSSSSMKTFCGMVGGIKQSSVRDLLFPFLKAFKEQQKACSLFPPHKSGVLRTPVWWWNQGRRKKQTGTVFFGSGSERHPPWKR